MGFLAKTSGPSEWKAVAATIQTLVEEATFDATAEGLTFRAMDPSHVALVDLTWPNAAFEKYTCDKQFKFAVRVADLVKLIRRSEARDRIEISGEEEAIVVTISNGYKREFKVHLIESSTAATPLPKLTFNSSILMEREMFEKVLTDVSTVSDHVVFDSTKDSINFQGKSDSGSVGIPLTSQDVIDLKVKEPSKATYSVEYLLNIVKAVGPVSDTVLCEYSVKMPLRLELKLGTQGGLIHFYLAPRIEEH